METAEINYQNNREEFLNYQLYIASKSDRVRRRRKRGKSVIPVCYILMGLFFLMRGSTGLGFIFCTIAILWYFIYPLWEAKYYVRHYKAFIKEHYEEMINRSVHMEIGTKHLTAATDNTQSSMAVSEIVSMVEISSAVFIRLKTGLAFIIAKANMAHPDEKISELKAVASRLNIPYITDNTWRWK